MAAFTGLLVLQTVVYFVSGVAECGVLPQTHSGVALPVCTRSCSSGESGDETRHKCSCSESCLVFGDCCPDSPHKNAASWQQFDFVCVSVAESGRYRAVSSCPEDQSSDLCGANLGYLPPVTSGSTGTTYGNYYCAWCNGDFEHLVTWEVDLNCLPTHEGSIENSSSGPSYIVYNQDELYKINLQEETESLCQFHVRGGNSSFLENLELRPCNTTSMVSECSSSWENISVAEKCRSYENPVYHQGTLYKNPHCAECHDVNPNELQCEPQSSETQLHPQTTQTNPRTKRVGDEKPPKSEGRPYAFSDLFKDCTPPQGSRCCVGQRYDENTNKCRNIR